MIVPDYLSSRAMLSCCSIPRACLFWVMHQKQNAFPTQTLDNMFKPIIYSVDDVLIPGFSFTKICFHLVTYWIFFCSLQTTLKNFYMMHHRNNSYLFDIEENELMRWFRVGNTKSCADTHGLQSEFGVFSLTKTPLLEIFVIYNFF